MQRTTSKILGSSDHHLHEDFCQRLYGDGIMLDFIIKNRVDGLWYTDLSVIDEEWISPDFWAMLGYKAEERTHLSSQWRGQIDAKDLPLMDANIQKFLIDPKHAFDQVFRFLHRDGSTLWLRVQALLIIEGEKRCLLRVLEDVSSRHQLEDNLASVRERFETAERGAGVGLWERSIGEGSKEYWSSEFYSLLGYEEQDIEASCENFNRLIHPSDIERFYEMVGQQCRGEDAMFEVECRFQTKLGQYKWFRASGFAVISEDKDINRMLGVIHDIDERKIYEDALEQAVVNLKHSNEELERFAYIASHDLQEPLRVMTTYVELLEQRFASVFDEEAKEYVGFVVDASKRMKHLIRDLLEYSRLGKSSLEKNDVDLKSVMDRVAQSLISKIDAKKAELKFDDLPTVKGNTSELERVMQNLVGNAIKYAHKDRQPEVTVRCRDTGKGYWCISVEDNGIGVKARYFDKIFEIFQRLHSASRYEGTGVGLAICKRIILRHGGKIWLESVPEKGATFYFTLPKSADKES